MKEQERKEIRESAMQAAREEAEYSQRLQTEQSQADTKPRLKKSSPTRQVQHYRVETRTFFDDHGVIQGQ